ncbi:MAG: ferredoxin [Bosea sp. 12-68-7]|nr:four-helix bundle copper-binding protein [Falsiroseomonas tokyonensis]OYW68335.1 MAG: ferredoxin [Bosea sp. 12-68-7]OYX03475.1 MAG: ferredoxin [Bosea sp. 32-68-6]
MDMSNCIRECLDCHRSCTETVIHVLHGGGHHAEATHLVSLLDCAQICITSADFMARHSPHHAHLCRECAEICEACAKLCEEHEDPDGRMKANAEACRRCAATCREMAGAA